MCVSAALGLGSALVGAASSRSAANQQQDAAQDQLKLAREGFEYQKEQFAPYGEAGQNAMAAYLYEMGLGPKPMVGGTTPEITTLTGQGRPGSGSAAPGETVRWVNMSQSRLGQDPSYEGRINAMNPGNRRGDLYQVGDQQFGSMQEAQAYADANPTGGTPYEGFTGTPGYDFRLNEGLDAVEARASQFHSLDSGATKKALTQFGQDYATSEYTPFLNRLSGITDLGQNSAAGQARASQNYVNTGANAMANYGDAGASGAIGVGNAFQGGLNNALGMWAYQNAQQQPGTQTVNPFFG